MDRLNSVENDVMKDPLIGHSASVDEKDAEKNTETPNLAYELINGDEDKTECSHCGAVFKSSYQLYKHRNSKSTNCCRKPRRCKYCFKEFRNLAGFRKHCITCWRERTGQTKMKKKRGSQGLSKKSSAAAPVQDIKPEFREFAEQLGLMVKTEPEVEAMVVERKPKKLPDFRTRIPEVRCSRCGVMFRSMAHYTLHQKRKFSCVPEEYVCTICRKNFKKLHHLLSHKKRKSACVAPQEEAATVESTVPETSTPNGPTIFECDKCEAKFLYAHLRKRHIDNHHKVEENLAASDLQLSNLNQYLTEGGYKCFKCDKIFPYPYRLRDHLSRKIPCTQMDAPTIAGELTEPVPPSPTALPVPLKRAPGWGSKLVNKYRKLVMNGKKPVEAFCKICDVTFGSRSACYKHCSRYHPKIPIANIVTFIPDSVTIKPIDNIKSSKPKIGIPKNLVNSPSEMVEKKLLGNMTKVEEVPREICEIPLLPLTEPLSETKSPNKSPKVKTNNKIRCPDCPDTFKFPYLMLEHKRKFHATSKKCLCPICNKSFVGVKARNSHIRPAHREAQFTAQIDQFFKDTHCSNCRKTFSTPENKTQHEIDIHRIKMEDPSSRCLCPYCAQSFTTKHHYTAHINRYCKFRIEQKSTSRLLSPPASPESKIFCCVPCDLKFKGKTLYKAHVNRFCPLKEPSRSRDSKQELFGLDDKVHLVCGSCKAEFSRKLEYDVHVSDLCPMRVDRKEKRMATIAQHTFVNGTFSCSTCLKSFPSKFHYAAHKKFCGKEVAATARVVENTEEKELDTLQSTPPKKRMSVYNCPFCRRTFTSIMVRNRHLRAHSTVKGYTCRHCPNKYTRMEYLTRHMQSDHPDCMKYRCGKCQRSYPLRSSCLQHITKQHLDITNKNEWVQEINRDIVLPVHDPTLCPTLLQQATIPSIPDVVDVMETSSVDNSFTIKEDTPGRGIYTCNICKISNFTKISALRRHWRTKQHKDAKREQHHIKQNNSVEKLRHETRNSLLCSICDESFNSISAFVPHRLSHFKSEQHDPADISISNPYSCEICGKVFIHHQRVQAHFLGHLKEQRLQRPQATGRLIRLPIATRKQKPGIPKVVRDGLPLMVSAKKSIGGTPSNYPSTNFLYNTSPVPPEDRASPKRCSKCKKVFSSSSPLIEHQKNCLRCKHCSLEFNSSADLGWHQKCCLKVNESSKSGKIHNNLIAVWPPCEEEHLLQCCLCKENHYNMKGLKSHYTECHPHEEFNITCLPCELSFTDPLEAKYHVSMDRSIPSPVGDKLIQDAIPTFFTPADKTGKQGDSPVTEPSDHTSESGIVLDRSTSTNTDVGLLDGILTPDAVQAAVANVIHVRQCSTSPGDSRTTTNRHSKCCKDRFSNSGKQSRCCDNPSKLKEDFSQLMYLLIGDVELMNQLGWGKEAIEVVLASALMHLGKNPEGSGGQSETTFHQNISVFLSLCIKEEILKGVSHLPLDLVVVQMLKMAS